jgi:hypothetical protein
MPALKPITFIAPIAALALAGTWLSTQRQSISSLEQQNNALRNSIAAQSASTASDTQTDKTLSNKKESNNKQIDWKKIAAEFRNIRQHQGMGDMRTTIRLQQQLQKLTKKELINAITEIATLDFPEETRNMLEMMLLGPLIEKDPELALNQFIDRIQDNDGALSWQLSLATQKWAKTDPTAASAWLDKQIAAGKFDSRSLDGKNQSRTHFEGTLIHALLSSNPAEASRRLAAIPDDQRKDTLSQFSFQQLKDEDQPAFAKLVRDHLPTTDQSLTLARHASRIVSNGNFSKVTEFLDRIQATPTERTTCAVEAAESSIRSISHQNKISRENLETMREWLNSQAPESTDHVTGKALANAIHGNHKLEFSEAAELALQYHESSNNDAVLSSFLEGWPARQNKEQARMIAEKISNPERREEILENLQ